MGPALQGKLDARSPAAIHGPDQRRRCTGDGGSLSGADGGPLPRAPRGGAGRDGGGRTRKARSFSLNLQAEKQFGYPRDELLGQKVTNIIPKGFAERLISDSTRTAAEALAQQIGTGIELTARRKDGSEFPIEIMLSPLESADGVLVTAAIRDISVRKEAEEHLAQMEGRYRGLLEAAPDAMVVVDEDGEIVLLNLQAEKQFGYRRDELLGQKVTNIIPEGFAERLIADSTRTAAEALAQQIGTGIELTARRKDGSEFPIEIMLSPLESADGVLVTAAIRDISLRRKAEAAARSMTLQIDPFGPARFPHRPAEPAAAQRSRRPGDRARAAPRRQGRGPVPRRRRLQAHQRFARTPDRRQASPVDRGASARLRPGLRHRQPPGRR